MKIVHISLALIGVMSSLVGLYYLVWIKIKERIKNERRIYKLVENSRDIIYICDIEPDMKYHYLSPAIEKILGENIVQESFDNPYNVFERIHPDDFPVLYKKITGDLDYSKPIVQRWKDNQGKFHCFEEYCTPIFEKGVMTGLQGIIRNIDDKVELQAKLEYQANHDSLTGVYNRDYFESLLNQFDQKEDRSVGIILCDMDDLKKINDQYGHKRGDEIIKVIGGLLNQFSSPSVTVTRIGGDEFAIFVEGSEQNVEILRSHINETFNHYNESQTDININMSVGSAYVSSSITNMDRLYVWADQNMYKVKHARKTMLCTPSYIKTR